MDGQLRLRQCCSRKKGLKLEKLSPSQSPFFYCFSFKCYQSSFFIFPLRSCFLNPRFFILWVRFISIHFLDPPHYTENFLRFYFFPFNTKDIEGEKTRRRNKERKIINWCYSVDGVIFNERYISQNYFSPDQNLNIPHNF